MAKKTTTPKETSKKTTKKEEVKVSVSAENAKKLATKSASAKENEFNIKQVGQTLIIVKGTEKLSRKFADKDEREAVKQLAAKYSLKPSVKLYNEIKKVMSVDKEERKETIKEAIDISKGKGRTKPAEEKLQTKEEQIEAAKKLLQDNNYNVTAKTATPTRQFRGEH